MNKFLIIGYGAYILAIILIVFDVLHDKSAKYALSCGIVIGMWVQLTHHRFLSKAQEIIEKSNEQENKKTGDGAGS